MIRYAIRRVSLVKVLITMMLLLLAGCDAPLDTQTYAESEYTESYVQPTPTDIQRAKSENVRPEMPSAPEPESAAAPANTDITEGGSSYESSDHGAADARYGLLCIHNETDFDVIYIFKWGDGPWEEASIDQGRSRFHWDEYSYRGENRSDDFYIAFDSTPIANQDSRKDYVLPRYAALERKCYQGSQYEFRYTDNSHRYFELYTK